MTPDKYLQGILSRENVDTGPYSVAMAAANTVRPILQEWAGSALVSVQPSGSFAKGTANKSGTDIDLFISLSEATNQTLQEIYNSLFSQMQSKGYNPKRQNVSINVRVNSQDVDLVPAKRQTANTTEHSLYRRKADTWTKTDVSKHIAHVKGAGRVQESRILKLWRNQKGLDFPSFYLELTVIEALRGVTMPQFDQRILAVMRYLRDSFSNARVIDPANTNNVISDDLTATEKASIKSYANAALEAKNWGDIVK